MGRLLLNSKKKQNKRGLNGYNQTSIRAGERSTTHEKGMEEEEGVINIIVISILEFLINLEFCSLYMKSSIIRLQNASKTLEKKSLTLGLELGVRWDLKQEKGRKRHAISKIWEGRGHSSCAPKTEGEGEGEEGGERRKDGQVEREKKKKKKKKKKEKKVERLLEGESDAE
jgi:hypothetical protein